MAGDIKIGVRVNVDQATLQRLESSLRSLDQRWQLLAQHAKSAGMAFTQAMGGGQGGQYQPGEPVGASPLAPSPAGQQAFMQASRRSGLSGGYVPAAGGRRVVTAKQTPIFKGVGWGPGFDATMNRMYPLAQSRPSTVSPFGTPGGGMGNTAAPPPGAMHTLPPAIKLPARLPGLTGKPRPWTTSLVGSPGYVEDWFQAVGRPAVQETMTPFLRQEYQGALESFNQGDRAAAQRFYSEWGVAQKIPRHPSALGSPAFANAAFTNASVAGASPAAGGAAMRRLMQLRASGVAQEFLTPGFSASEPWTTKAIPAIEEAAAAHLGAIHGTVTRAAQSLANPEASNRELTKAAQDLERAAASLDRFNEAWRGTGAAASEQATNLTAGVQRMRAAQAQLQRATGAGTGSALGRVMAQTGRSVASMLPFGGAAMAGAEAGAMGAGSLAGALGGGLLTGGVALAGAGLVAGIAELFANFGQTLANELQMSATWRGLGASGGSAGGFRQGIIAASRPSGVSTAEMAQIAATIAAGGGASSITEARLKAIAGAGMGMGFTTSDIASVLAPWAQAMAIGGIQIGPSQMFSLAAAQQASGMQGQQSRLIQEVSSLVQAIEGTSAQAPNFASLLSTVSQVAAAGPAGQGTRGTALLSAFNAALTNPGAGAAGQLFMYQALTRGTNLSYWQEQDLASRGLTASYGGRTNLQRVLAALDRAFPAGATIKPGEVQLNKPQSFAASMLSQLIGLNSPSEAGFLWGALNGPQINVNAAGKWWQSVAGHAMPSSALAFSAAAELWNAAGRGGTVSARAHALAGTLNSLQGLHVALPSGVRGLLSRAEAGNVGALTEAERKLAAAVQAAKSPLTTSQQTAKDMADAVKAFQAADAHFVGAVGVFNRAVATLVGGLANPVPGGPLARTGRAVAKGYLSTPLSSKVVPNLPLMFGETLWNWLTGNGLASSLTAAGGVTQLGPAAANNLASLVYGAAGPWIANGTGVGSLAPNGQGSYTLASWTSGGGGGGYSSLPGSGGGPSPLAFGGRVPYFGQAFAQAGVPPQIAAAIEAFEGNVAPNRWNKDSHGTTSVGPLQLNSGGQGAGYSPAYLAAHPGLQEQLGIPPIAKAYAQGAAMGLSGLALFDYVLGHSGHPDYTGLSPAAQARAARIWQSLGGTLSPTTGQPELAAYRQASQQLQALQVKVSIDPLTIHVEGAGVHPQTVVTHPRTRSGRPRSPAGAKTYEALP